MPFARDTQKALTSERRSMPYLRQPTSNPFKRNQSSIDSTKTGRPVSPVLTVSSRPSVSSMKRLVPLRLQPTRPHTKIDLASWIENTIPNLQPPIASNFENELNEEIITCSPIPWMSSSQDVRLSYNLPPGRYRETPVYSGPGSPVLSPAYFSDEEPCYHCSPQGSVYDEICIESNYDNAKALCPQSQESVVDYADTFDADRIEYDKMFTTSFASTRMSKLSIGYCEDCIPPDEATWMKSRLGSWIKDGAREAASRNGSNEVHEEQNPFEGWLASESSRSSSSFSSDEVLDALVTKLAPAKPHLIELSKVLQALPNINGPPKTDLQGRPATPYQPSRRHKKTADYPTLALKKDNFDDGTVRLRQRRKATLLSSPSFDLEWESSTHSPPPSPMASTSLGILEEPFPEHQYHDTEPESTEPTRTIIDSIHDVVQDFPQQMLFLDTSCVTDIRHQNHLAQRKTDSRSFSNSSSSSSANSLLLDQRNLPTHRRRTATNFFAHLFLATTRKSSYSQKKAASSYANRPSSCISTDWKSLASKPDIPPPELSIFRHIFPDTQDWWRSVLYAHLVAFNYINENNTPPQRNVHCFPPKALRTLGISYGQSILASDATIRLTDLEENLVSCITWITHCMTGKRSAQRDINEYQDEFDRDHILVRALAEIAKVCERGRGGEGSVPQVR